MKIIEIKKNIKILHNWGLKLISPIIAIAVWFFVVQMDDPKITTTFSNIKVSLTNMELLEQENKVCEVLDNSDIVRVTVRAPRSVISNIRASDIVAEADMSKLTDINTIAITYYIQNAGSDSVEFTGNHDVVKLNVEERKSKYISIGYNIEGEAAEGYILGSVNLDLNSIEVSGPKSEVDQVSRAVADFDISGASTTLSANVELHLYDKEGNRLTLENVKKQTDYVHISVGILPTKEVSVDMEYQGEPATGYILTGDYSIEPSKVSIAGSSRVLSQITSIKIPKEALDISGCEGNFEKEINLSDYLPSDAKFVDSDFNGRVKIIIYAEQPVSKTVDVPTSNIEIINIPKNATAMMSENILFYKLKISGLERYVASVSGDTINGSIDVQKWMNTQKISNLTSGLYYMPINFLSQDGLTISNDVNAYVNIYIDEDDEDDDM